MVKSPSAECLVWVSVMKTVLIVKICRAYEKSTIETSFKRINQFKVLPFSVRLSDIVFKLNGVSHIDNRPSTD